MCVYIYIHISLVGSCLVCVMLVRVAFFDLCFPGLLSLLWMSGRPCRSPLPLIKNSQTGGNGRRLRFLFTRNKTPV